LAWNVIIPTYVYSSVGESGKKAFLGQLVIQSNIKDYYTISI